MTAQDFMTQAALLAYRIGAYMLLNWADDAAILAMMFC